MNVRYLPLNTCPIQRRDIKKVQRRRKATADVAEAQDESDKWVAGKEV